MNINNNIQKLIQESSIFYRSGPKQNIKEFIPRILKSAHKDSLKSTELIYVTDDSSYAAGFCFDWDDRDGFSFGKINNKQWMLKVPERFKDKLNSKCSMYHVTGKFEKIKELSTPEYLSRSIVKVVKEIKFSSCWECLKTYNVKVVIN